MNDHDFACVDNGTTATISTNSWPATQWIRENVPEAQGAVVGANYSTIVGEPRQMLEIALGLVAAGFTCENQERITSTAQA